MLISGTVEKVIFRNSENGYSVLIVSDASHSVTAVGVMPQITEGETLELEGDYSVNQKFGEQFNVKKATVCLPTGLDSIAKYLSSGLFKGIGEVTADAIVDEFGEDTFDIIEKKPIKLKSIRGVSAKKAMDIHETFISLKDMQNAILGLQKLDITLNMALKIYKIYGRATLDTINSNPYRLIEDIDGVGFATADKIAGGLGIAVDSEFRVRAGIIHLLKNIASEKGHTYLPKEELLNKAFDLLGLEYDVVTDLCEMAITTLEVTGIVAVIERDIDTAVMFSKVYLTERNIANKLVSLSLNCSDLHMDIEGDIAEYERISGIVMHEGQRNAVKNAVNNGVNIITGGPGTGKTTIIKCILSIFKSRHLEVSLCAPTGRASKRLSESTGEEAKTIHRLLDLDFKNGKGNFTFNSDTKLQADVIIVDEVSMCDEYVFNALLSAINRGCRLILVGDKDQLPSVGAGNVLGDIIGFGDIPISELTYIYRQGQESLIIANAHRINNGDMPIIRNKDSDFLFSEVDNQSAVLDTVVNMVAKRIPNYLNINPSAIQVLCPMKKQLSGVNNMNKELQRAINPESKTKAELRFMDGIFREGDKVIHIVNNYDLDWLRGSEVGQGVFNGDIGFIRKVNHVDNTLTIEFDDERVATYSRDIFEQIKLAYAITVHKSQGCEFDVVVIVLMGGMPTLMTRNLLYTAVTRAKSMSVIVGSSGNMSHMVSNNFTAKRYTLLKEMLAEEMSRQCAE